MNKSQNPDFPYWRYQSFNINNLNEDECIANFRFKRNDIYNLRELLRIPENVICYNRTKVDGLEALCIFLTLFMPGAGQILPLFWSTIYNFFSTNAISSKLCDF